tara:strand:+ start:271 stop:528 length:258 start_codon:yes stop_codon:yes gene_type:complete
MNKNLIRQSALKLNLTEKEKIDVDQALTILEKISSAELIFANKVLLELQIKTICQENGDEHQMEYWSLEQCKRFAELDKKINATH